MGELFTTFGVNIPLLIAQIINFGILLLALWYFLYTPMMNMIDQRQERIAQGVSDAEKAQERLHEIEDERDSIITEATQKADETIASSKARAEEQAQSIATDAQQKAENILTSAHTRATEIEAETMRKSEAEISKMAILAAEKIMREKKS